MRAAAERVARRVVVCVVRCRRGGRVWVVVGAVVWVRRMGRVCRGGERVRPCCFLGVGLVGDGVLGGGWGNGKGERWEGGEGGGDVL